MMLFPLRVGKIGTFIGVQGQTKTAFEEAKVVPEAVRILPGRVRIGRKEAPNIPLLLNQFLL